MRWESNMHVFPNPLRGLQHRKGPRKGFQGSAQLLSTCFSPPSLVPFSAPHTPSLCLLCSVPPAAPDTFTSYVFSDAFSLRFLYIRVCHPSLPLSVCLSFSSWMLMTSISVQLSCSWAKITDYRDRGFTFPENLNLSNLQRCDAWQPSKVSFFLLTPEY